MSNSVTTVREAKPQWVRRVALLLGGTLVAIFLVLQGVALVLPRSNPPVIAEPAWDSPQTRELFMRACGDCHSNQTNWRWYTYVAPAAFLAYRDVTEGRQKCNVSEWGVSGEQECDDSAETIQEGTMPPWFYTMFHAEARLSPQEKQQLIQGLLATFGEGEEGPGGENEEEGGAGGENEENEEEEEGSGGGNQNYQEMRQVLGDDNEKNQEMEDDSSSNELHQEVRDDSSSNEPYHQGRDDSSSNELHHQGRDDSRDDDEKHQAGHE